MSSDEERVGRNYNHQITGKGGKIEVRMMTNTYKLRPARFVRWGPLRKGPAPWKYQRGVPHLAAGWQEPWTEYLPDLRCVWTEDTRGRGLKVTSPQGVLVIKPAPI